jgi:hypothetical protein
MAKIHPTAPTTRVIVEYRPIDISGMTAKNPKVDPKMLEKIQNALKALRAAGYSSKSDLILNPNKRKQLRPVPLHGGLVPKAHGGPCNIPRLGKRI